LEIINHTSFEAEAIPFKGPDGGAFATLIVKGTFKVKSDGRVDLAETQLPIAYGDTTYPDGSGTQFEADVAPFKPRADIVVVGHAHAPGEAAVQGLDVSLRVGAMQRVLRVFGNRQWHCTSFMPAHATDPEPFVKMPLTYALAYGGIDIDSGSFCRENLTGRGHFGKARSKTVHQKPLPNIESPNHLIRSPKDHPKPAGFGFYGRAWHPRAGFLGTYDDQWRKTRSPEPPVDFRHEYYNAAHPDLQWDGYLAGDEAVELIHLTPDQPVWRFNLPHTHPVCTVGKSYAALAAYLEAQGVDEATVAGFKTRQPHQEDVQLNLDTLCIMPDETSFFLLWRGRISVFDLTALEISAIEVF
jgi:hypothetical protein